MSSLFPECITARAQRIWISCQAQDFQTHRFVAASWQWSDSTGRPVCVQQASTDGFRGYVPPQARYLTVTSRDYRSVQLPVHWFLSGSDSVSFQFVVPVVPIDKPGKNQPYFQSEQRPLQLADSSTHPSTVSVKFRVYDALTGRPVRASLCLFLTGSHQQRCYETSSITTKLTRPDIVAIEVKVAGYQDYLGNLVIADTSSESVSDYRIGLNPTPTILAVATSNPYPDLTLKRSDDPSEPALTTADGLRFWAAARPGFYRLTSRSPIPESELLLAEGLTAYHLVLPVSRPHPSWETTIHFSQSSYELSDSSKRQLDRLAAILKQNPQLKAHITGHTDNVGNPHLNHTLSEFRAKITRGYLLRRGIQEGRLSLTAAGSGQPAAANDTEENRQRNRRVSLIIRE